MERGEARLDARVNDAIAHAKAQHAELAADAAGRTDALASAAAAQAVHADQCFVRIEADALSQSKEMMAAFAALQDRLRTELQAGDHEADIHLVEATKDLQAAMDGAVTQLQKRIGDAQAVLQSELTNFKALEEQQRTGLVHDLVAVEVRMTAALVLAKGHLDESLAAMSVALAKQHMGLQAELISESHQLQQLAHDESMRLAGIIVATAEKLSSDFAAHMASNKAEAQAALASEQRAREAGHASLAASAERAFAETTIRFQVAAANVNKLGEALGNELAQDVSLLQQDAAVRSAAVNAAFLDIRAICAANRTSIEACTTAQSLYETAAMVAREKLIENLAIVEERLTAADTEGTRRLAETDAAFGASLDAAFTALTNRLAEADARLVVANQKLAEDLRAATVGLREEFSAKLVCQEAWTGKGLAELRQVLDDSLLQQLAANEEALRQVGVHQVVSTELDTCIR